MRARAPTLFFEVSSHDSEKDDHSFFAPKRAVTLFLASYTDRNSDAGPNIGQIARLASGLIDLPSGRDPPIPNRFDARPTLNIEY